MKIQEIINKIVYCTDALIKEVEKSKDNILNLKIEPYPGNLSSSPFIKREKWENNKSVNIFDVIGTAHPDYIGHSWIRMLKVGKRMKTINLPLLEKNPDYYFEKFQKEPAIEYTRINDRLYISGDGNHRTSIAKVLFYFIGSSQFAGIKYREVEIDFETMELFEYARALIAEKKLPLVIEVESKHIKRKDGPGWSEDFFWPEFEIVNTKRLKRVQFDISGLKQFVKEMRQFNLFRKFFNPGKMLKKIL